MSDAEPTPELYVIPAKFLKLFYSEQEKALSLLEKGVKDILSRRDRSPLSPPLSPTIDREKQRTRSAVIRALLTPTHVGELMEWIWPSQLRLIDIVCQGGSLRSLKILLSLGCNPHIGLEIHTAFGPNPKHEFFRDYRILRTPAIVHAVINHHPEQVSLLLEHGAKVYDSSSTLQSGNFQRKETFKDHYRVNPIVRCACSGDHEILKLLVEHIRNYPSSLPVTAASRDLLVYTVKKTLSNISSSMHSNIYSTTQSSGSSEDFLQVLQILADFIGKGDRYGLAHHLCHTNFLSGAKDVRVLEILINASNRPRSWYQRKCCHTQKEYGHCLARIVHHHVRGRTNYEIVRFLLSKGFRADCTQDGSYKRGTCANAAIGTLFVELSCFDSFAVIENSFKNLKLILAVLRGGKPHSAEIVFSRHLARITVKRFSEDPGRGIPDLKKMMMLLFMSGCVEVPFLVYGDAHVRVGWPCFNEWYFVTNLSRGVGHLVDVVRTYQEATLFDKLSFHLEMLDLIDF